jgi:hypothetical protein
MIARYGQKRGKLWVKFSACSEVSWQAGETTRKGIIGIPPSLQESVLQRIDRAREVVAEALAREKGEGKALESPFSQ